MNEEQIAKAREAKSAEELLALAKENGMEMTEEEAADLYNRLHSSTELTDEELENVAGGGCGTNSTVKIDGVSYPKAGKFNSCTTGNYEGNSQVYGWKDHPNVCYTCIHFVQTDKSTVEGYCNVPF